MDKQRQPLTFADLEGSDDDFEKYLERELGKLAETKAEEEAKQGQAKEDQTENARPAPPPKVKLALSAFPPKPRAPGTGLVSTVPPLPSPHSPQSSSSRSISPVSPLPPPPPPPTAPLPPPPAAVSPTTNNNRHLSFLSLSSDTSYSTASNVHVTATARRPIKYGTGKHAGVELVPQPSDDPGDPLNWPRWKKEAHYATLVLFVALVSVMKTALFAVHSQVATGYAVSYTAAAALTGVPLMVSAGSGFVCLVASRLWGKRPLYLASCALLFIGTMWAITVPGASFGQCMAARVLQGLGWGAFDVLVLGSVHDTFFEHEREQRTTAVDLVSVACTWGGPLLGGVVSASTAKTTFGAQFAVLGGLLVVATLALLIVVPETTYDRSFYSINTPVPVSAWSNEAPPLRQHTKLSALLSKEAVANYLKDFKDGSLRPASYVSTSSATDTAILLQVPRAMAAPTTALLTLVTLLPFCALWGLAASLGLLFAPLPFNLSPRGLGALLTGPWLLATLAVLATSGGGLALLGRVATKYGLLAPAWAARFLSTARHNITAIAIGTLLVFTGLLTFGLYIASSMRLTTAAALANHASIFRVAAVGTAITSQQVQVRLPAVSFLLGLLAAGCYLLGSTARPMVRRSAQFTAPNLALADRNTVDMCGGLVVWRTLVSGAFVIALPNAVWLYTLLQAASVGLVVAHVLVASAVGVVWWRYDETVRRLDGQVIRCVDLGMLKRTGSFFETD